MRRANGNRRADRSSHVVSIVHPSDARSDESVRAIVAAYKARFAQEAVLRSTARACVSH